MGGAGATTYGRRANDEAGDRLTSATGKLRDATSMLETAKRQALESEDIAVEVISDLNAQRNTILRTRKNMTEFGANIGAAKDTLDRMFRHIAANRIMIYAVGFFFLLMIGAVVYFTMGGGGADSSFSSG